MTNLDLIAWVVDVDKCLFYQCPSCPFKDRKACRAKRLEIVKSVIIQAVDEYRDGLKGNTDE